MFKNSKHKQSVELFLLKININQQICKPLHEYYIHSFKYLEFNIFINYIYLIQSKFSQMKELILETTSSDNTDNTMSQPQTTSKLNKKDRIKKNITIRKNKITSQILTNGDQTIKPKLSKQEKYQLQKIKNRQSAQRSRDMKKIYVQQLQNENQSLKLQIQSLNQRLKSTAIVHRMCSKCSKQIIQEQKDEMPMFQKFQEEQNQKILLSTQEINITDEDRYQRIIEQSNGNKFSMFVFILVTILGIIMFNKNLQIRSTPQILFKLDSINHIIAQKNLNSDLKDSNSIMNIQSPKTFSSEIALKSNTQDTCLHQYLKQKKKIFPQLLPPKNLRASGTQNYYQTNDILLCHMPQIIKHNKSSSLISNNLQILMKGNELAYAMQYQESGYEVNPNNLYMVLVQVKDIVKYSNFECLV